MIPWRADGPPPARPSRSRQQPDRADGVLIDRIVMVHVELHLRDDAAEIGHEAAEHPRLVHPAQHRSGSRGEVSTSRNKRVGARIAADLSSISLASRAAARIVSGWISRPCWSASAKHLDQPDGIVLEEVLVGQRQPAAIEHEAVELGEAAPDARQTEAPSARGELLVEMRQEHTGQVADRLRLQEIILHEAFDRRFARPVGKAHPLGDLALDVEGQPVLGAPGDRVQMAPHRPQEIVGAVELAVFLAREAARPRPVRST